MEPFKLVVPATPDNYDDAGYLAANPDVRAAVAEGLVSSARDHFEAFALTENRRLRRALPWQLKQRKLERVRPLLRPDRVQRETPTHFDCLSQALRERFRIVGTDAISEHEYDHQSLALIERHAGGLVLDCGAGQRNSYYNHVVNYEIVAYDSTDVLGVAEALPFHEGSFDAVLCLNVLEHVKDPFQVARELVRVLRPGGELYVVAPFLQPRHGYPHHYYNMTREGLLGLFEDLESPRIRLYGAMQPIWALNWFLHRYTAGLPAAERARFESMRVAELLVSPTVLEQDAIALQLSDEARTELASAHGLLARKPA